MINRLNMEITLVEAIVGIGPVILAGVGIYIRGQRQLREQLARIRETLAKTITEEKVRIMIQDQLLPLRVEYKALEQRLDELRTHNMMLGAKIDHLLEILRNYGEKKKD